MEIKKAGSQASIKGPSDWFTGIVRIDPLFQAPDPALVQGASVTFEPGARTAWHTHPLGQTLIVTAGCGRAQREGGPVEEIRPGDVVWFSPGEKHCMEPRHDGHDSHRYSGETRREGCRLDGTGQRGAIQELIGGRGAEPQLRTKSRVNCLIFAKRGRIWAPVETGSTRIQMEALVAGFGTTSRATTPR